MGSAIPGIGGILGGIHAQMSVRSKAYPINTTLLQPQYPWSMVFQPSTPKDVYVRQTALDWLDEQINRVIAHGRDWHSVEIPKAKFPPPVSDGLPVRLLPNGDYLWAPDVDPNAYANITNWQNNNSVNWSR